MKIPTLPPLLRHPRFYAGALILLLIWAGFDTPRLNALDALNERGILRVAIRPGPLSYYRHGETTGGLDYRLLNALADHLGVELQVRLYENLDALLAAVHSNGIDLAAATLTATETRQSRYQFSQPYLHVAMLLVQHSRKPRPASIAELLAGSDDYRLQVVAGSSHAEKLRELRRDHPQLHWQEDAEVIMFQLLEKVQSGELDYSLVDSSILQLERAMFPRIEVALPLTEPQPVGFAFARSPDHSLLEAIDGFLRDYRDSGALGHLRDNYLNHQGRLDVAGAALFRRRLEERLPEYEPLFREVAAEYDHDWLLLAAQAYQESHWEPRARSATGVRGMMMLTRPTAQQMGVTDRLDAEQSLRGGLAYLQHLHGRIPSRIPEPDRTKLALAAYNVGLGHLNDARTLARRAGANPDSWSVLARYLPLLRQKKYYSTVRHGYARGQEPVTYVTNIYNYKRILDWHIWQRELQFDTLFEDRRNGPATTPYQDILDASLAPL
ncbi:MAG: membrane-bound lytic murein transglycosylase MltF [Cellvibrionales bacterium]|nr:membrane-bound lytic murein transglycosylase MltF [Cellvibrionales bacterium]